MSLQWRLSSPFSKFVTKYTLLINWESYCVIPSKPYIPESASQHTPRPPASTSATKARGRCFQSWRARISFLRKPRSKTSSERFRSIRREGFLKTPNEHPRTWPRPLFAGSWKLFVCQKTIVCFTCTYSTLPMFCRDICEISAKYVLKQLKIQTHHQMFHFYDQHWKQLSKMTV